MPVLLLIGVGVWAQRRPQPVVAPAPTLTVRGPVQLETKTFKLVPLSAADAESGADTKVAIEFVPTGKVSGPVPTVGWDWGDSVEVRTIAGKTLFDSWRGPMERGPVVGFGGSSLPGWPLGNMSYSKTMLLRLRDVPPERGAIELRWDVALGPNALPANGQTESAKMAQLAASGRVPMRTERLILRRAGERVKKPVVSTDPMFDVRKITITPSPETMRTGPVKIVLDVFYRGALSNLENEMLPVNTRWKLMGRDGRVFYDTGYDNFFKATGAQRRGQIVYNVDFSTRKSLFKDQPLTLHGRVNLNGAWHKNIDIPVP